MSQEKKRREVEYILTEWRNGVQISEAKTMEVYDMPAEEFDSDIQFSCTACEECLADMQKDEIE